MDPAALPEPTSILDILAMVGFPYMALVSIRLFRAPGGDLAGLGMSMALTAVLGFLTWLEVDFAIPLTVNATDGTGYAKVEIPLMRTLAEFAAASVFAGLFVRCLDAWRVARDNEALLRFQRTALWVIIMLISGVVIYEVHFATTLPMRTAILSIGGASVFIIGLAMQSTLGNIFAGYGLQTSRVFRRGDTVQLGHGGAVGTVFDSTLATTRIVTRDGEMLVLPNSAVLTKDFMNLDQPNSHLRQSIKIGISYEVPPAVFKDIAMKVLLSEANVLRTPAPAVWLADFGDSAVQYDLRFWVDGFDVRDATLDQVRTRLWYAVADAGIEIPFPIRTIRMASTDEDAKRAAATRQRIEHAEHGLLACSLFDEGTITALERKELARATSEKAYLPGAMVIRRGDVCDAMFVVVSGACHLNLPSGERINFEPGAHFGEIALITQAARSADVFASESGTVLLQLPRASVMPILQRRPEFMARMQSIADDRRDPTRIGPKKQRGRAHHLVRRVLSMMRPI